MSSDHLYEDKIISLTDDQLRNALTPGTIFNLLIVKYGLQYRLEQELEQRERLLDES